MKASTRTELRKATSLLIPGYKAFVLFFVVLFIPPAVYAQNTFPRCDGSLYFLRSGTSPDTIFISSLKNYTNGPAVVTNLFNLGYSYINALAANPIDGYLYYEQSTSLSSVTSALIRIDNLGNQTVVCSTMPHSLAGCFDNYGRYWAATASFDDRTIITAYSPYTCTPVKQDTLALSIYNLADFTYNVTNCHFYAQNSAENHAGPIIEFDTNGVITNQYPCAVAMGNLCTGNDGNVYGISWTSPSANISEFNISTTATTAVTTISPGADTLHGVDMASFPCTVAQADFAVPTCVIPGVPVNFTNLSTGPIIVYGWNFGDGNYADAKTPTHEYISPGTDTIKLLVIAQPGTCYPILPTLFTQVVKVGYPTPIQLCCDTSIMAGDTVSLHSGGEQSYVWSPMYNLTCPTCLSTRAYPRETTRYTVIGTDSNGCKLTDSVLIQVENCSDIFIPSAFTPNGDGRDDFFGPVGDCINTYSMYIFDRWGNTLYSNGQSQPWDGKTNGKTAVEDIYVYKIVITTWNFTTKTIVGGITLLK